MNGHSTLALACPSKLWSTISDRKTSRSSSNGPVTVGIGSLGSKAFHALGEIALRGFENLAIHRRLRSNSSLFPHHDDNENKDINKIYDEVLELTRPGLYQLQARKQALKWILVQIGTRQTRHLMRHLIKWSPMELVLFLAELMACMPPDWLPPGTDTNDMHRELMTSYFTCQKLTTPEDHPAFPLVDFILAFSQINIITCHAVLKAGFLDMLLCMYICNFDSMMPQDFTSVLDESMILEAFSYSLLQLCEQPGALRVISTHPLRVLWPQSRSLGLRFGWQPEKRPKAWRQLGHVIVARRLAVLPYILALPLPHNDFPPPYLVEACTDLVEFSSHTTYGFDIAEDALRCIRRCVEELSESHWTALNDVLSDVHPAISNDIFRRLMLRGIPIQLLLKSLPLSCRVTLSLTAIPVAPPLERRHGRSISLPPVSPRMVLHDVLSPKSINDSAKKNLSPTDTPNLSSMGVLYQTPVPSHERSSPSSRFPDTPSPCLRRCLSYHGLSTHKLLGGMKRWTRLLSKVDDLPKFPGMEGAVSESPISSRAQDDPKYTYSALSSSEQGSPWDYQRKEAARHETLRILCSAPLVDSPSDSDSDILSFFG